MDAKLFRAEEVDWTEPPGHHSAFSKLLINETHRSKFFDFRISSYQPKGCCEPHTHETNENIYYVIKGQGVVELDGKRHLISPRMVVFIPAGMPHWYKVSGDEPIEFICVVPNGDDEIQMLE